MLAGLRVRGDLNSRARAFEQIVVLHIGIGSSVSFSAVLRHEPARLESHSTHAAACWHAAADRNLAWSALDRINNQSRRALIDPSKFERFGSLMRENVTTGIIPFTKAY